MKKKYYFRLTVVLLLMCSVMMFVAALQVNASSNQPVKGQDEVKDEQGYLQYANHYYIDMVRTYDLLKVAKDSLQDLANMQLNSIKFLSLVTIMLFYHTMNFNLAGYFKDEISTIQAAMRSSVFEPLFFIGCAGCAIIIIKRLLKRDFIGMYGQLLKVIMIFCLSLLVVQDSGTVIEMTTQLTTSIGAEILSGDESANYAKNVAENMWYNMVHLPWEYAEFGADVHTDEDVLFILQHQQEEVDRIQKAEQWDGEAFQTSRAGERIAFLLLYSFPFAVKCFIYIVMAGILLLLQVMAVFYVLLAPLVLILAMFPTFEHIIGLWLRKFLEIQISALIMYVAIGLLLRVDEILFNNVAQVWGWMVVLTLQVVLYVGVILKHNEILGAIGKIGVPQSATVQSGMNSIKAASIKSMAAARTLGVKVFVAQRGIAATAKVMQKSNPKGKTVERPVINKVSSGAATSVSKIQSNKQSNTNGGSNQSGAYTEHFRPSRVEFVERRVSFDFGPFEEPTKEFEDEPAPQRPRMDEIMVPDSDYREIKPVERPTAEPSKKEVKQVPRPRTYANNRTRNIK